MDRTRRALSTAFLPLEGGSDVPSLSEIQETQHREQRLSLSRSLRPYLVATFAFSLVANLLLLVSPIYMLQIYDRVVTSGSIDALIWLSAIAVFLLAIYGAAEAGRRRTLAMAADRLDDQLSPMIFAAFEARPDEGMELDRNLRRLRQVRGAFTSGTILPFIDLPFAPLFIACLFFIHPLLGVIGVAGALVVLAIAVVAEVSTREASGLSASLESASSDFASGLSRQRSAIVAMGLGSAAFGRWKALQDKAALSASSAGRGDNLFAALSRSSRQALQIGVLGAGAALALSQSISLGSIVAGSIILARALAPIDQIVGGWRQTVSARRSFDALLAYLEGAGGGASETTALPRPEASLHLKRLAVAAPGGEDTLVRPFTFEAHGGDVIALMGSNGSGKTSLLQTIAGAWRPQDGIVALGGRDLHAWSSSDRGRHVGYVPQDVEILPGTVRDNIARFTACEDALVFAAAQRANAHEMILALPDGFDTLVGPGGRGLSSGQKQMLGLARAMFGNPVLLLLDEPTANLDTSTVTAFLSAIDDAAAGGSIIIGATHDLRFLRHSATVLVIRAGSVVAADTAQYLQASSLPEPKERTG